MKNLIYPIILAGGSGTRLWPRSREKQPKQFIPLIEGKSLFQHTCERFLNTAMFGELTIITHEDHRFLVRDQLQELGITNAYILTEPIAKNTAAACLLGAHFIQQTAGDVPILFAPADHIIKDGEPLLTVMKQALPYVQNGAICIFGITPTHAHTGYGYIQGKKELASHIVDSVIFVEKPTKEKAEELLKEGALWNSGLYFCIPSTLEKEAYEHIPETGATLKKFFVEKFIPINEFHMVPKKIYEPLVPLSIDKAIAEKTSNLILAKTDIVWNDLGSWASLYKHFDKNEDGNVIQGDAVLLETTDSYIESSNRLVTVHGLHNIGVVETPDAVSIFALNESEKVKDIVAILSELNRGEAIDHMTVHRPWGRYTILGDDVNFNSKKIIVLPGAGLSLQRHKLRAEHWIVIEGIATVTKGAEVFELKKNESTFIPMGEMHRLQNNHKELLVIIEVQTGTYFGEDDIERFSDTYGRV